MRPWPLFILCLFTLFNPGLQAGQVSLEIFTVKENRIVPAGVRDFEHHQVQGLNFYLSTDQTRCKKPALFKDRLSEYQLEAIGKALGRYFPEWEAMDKKGIRFLVHSFREIQFDPIYNGYSILDTAPDGRKQITIQFDCDNFLLMHHSLLIHELSHALLFFGKVKVPSWLQEVIVLGIEWSETGRVEMDLTDFYPSHVPVHRLLPNSPKHINALDYGQARTLARYLFQRLGDERDFARLIPDRSPACFARAGAEFSPHQFMAVWDCLYSGIFQATPISDFRGFFRHFLLGLILDSDDPGTHGLFKVPGVKKIRPYRLKSADPLQVTAMSFSYLETRDPQQLVREVENRKKQMARPQDLEFFIINTGDFGEFEIFELPVLPAFHPHKWWRILLINFSSGEIQLMPGV